MASSNQYFLFEAQEGGVTQSSFHLQSMFSFVSGGYKTQTDNKDLDQSSKQETVYTAAQGVSTSDFLFFFCLREGKCTKTAKEKDFCLFALWL